MSWWFGGVHFILSRFGFFEQQGFEPCILTRNRRVQNPAAHGVII